MKSLIPSCKICGAAILTGIICLNCQLKAIETKKENEELRKELMRYSDKCIINKIIFDLMFPFNKFTDEQFKELICADNL
jgi:ribosomal protein L32